MIYRILTVILMLAGMAVAQGRAPGDFYPDSGTGSSTNPAYARGLTVYGSVETNDVMIFTDRTGSKGRGTNLLVFVTGISTGAVAEVIGDETAAREASDTALISSNAAARAAITAEAGTRAAGDTAALTNHVAAVAEEALLRAAGDAGARAELAAFAATGSVTRLVGSNAWIVITGGTGVLWRIERGTNIWITSTSVDFAGEGLTPGYVFSPKIIWEDYPEFEFWANMEGVLSAQHNLPNTYFEVYDANSLNWYGTGNTLPMQLHRLAEGEWGTCVIDWAPETNAYIVAMAADVVRRDGTLPMTGDLDMDGHSITNLSPNTIYFTDGRTLPGIIPSAGWRNETYWSIGMEERFESISRTDVVTNQDEIAMTQYAGYGKVNWQITPEILRGFPTGAFGFSVSGTAGTIDQDGLLTMTEAGLVDVTVTNGAVSKTVQVDLYYSSEGDARTCIYAGVPGSARESCITNIDTRLDGDANYWTTINHTTPNYVKNSNCWASAADFSGVVMATAGRAGYWYGTLITTQHILMAKHAYDGVGAVKRFVGRSGTNYSRTITAIRDPMPGVGWTQSDYVIGKLSAPLPPGDCKVYQVLPAGYTNQFPTGFARIPAMIYNQDKEVHVADMRGLASIYQPTDTNRLAYWEAPYGGDSGCPVFMWVGNEPVLMFLLSQSLSGINSPVTYGARMNELLALDGAALTTVDLSAFTEF